MPLVKWHVRHLLSLPQVLKLQTTLHIFFTFVDSVTSVYVTNSQVFCLYVDVACCIIQNCFWHAMVAMGFGPYHCLWPDSTQASAQVSSTHYMWCPLSAPGSSWGVTYVSSFGFACQQKIRGCAFFKMFLDSCFSAPPPPCSCSKGVLVCNSIAQLMRLYLARHVSSVQGWGSYLCTSSKMPVMMWWGKSLGCGTVH